MATYSLITFLSLHNHSADWRLCQEKVSEINWGNSVNLTWFLSQVSNFVLKIVVYQPRTGLNLFFSPSQSPECDCMNCFSLYSPRISSMHALRKRTHGNICKSFYSTPNASSNLENELETERLRMLQLVGHFITGSCSWRIFEQRIRMNLWWPLWNQVSALGGVMDRETWAGKQIWTNMNSQSSWNSDK